MYDDNSATNNNDNTLSVSTEIIREIVNVEGMYITLCVVLC